MEDQSSLIATIKEVSDKYWAEKRAPALLSALAPLLEKKHPGFRDLLGSRKLKAFIMETSEAAGYKLVEHPSQLERVGVVPIDASYEFRSESPHHLSETLTTKSNQEATLAFFRALATLPASDLEKLVIPASVLVKLLK